MQSDLAAAQDAANAASRREAVAQAIERHPDVAERVEKAIAEHAGKDGKLGDELVPAAPRPTWPPMEVASRARAASRTITSKRC